MTDPESDSRDERGDGERHDAMELETLTRGDDWEGEAFRDAGEATFGSRGRRSGALTDEARRPESGR